MCAKKSNYPTISSVSLSLSYSLTLSLDLCLLLLPPSRTNHSLWSIVKSQNVNRIQFKYQNSSRQQQLSMEKLQTKSIMFFFDCANSDVSWHFFLLFLFPSLFIHSLSLSLSLTRSHLTCRLWLEKYVKNLCFCSFSANVFRHIAKS